MVSYEVINGVEYQIYIPENVDSNTQVALYMHGGGDNTAGANDAVSYLQDGTCNSIVIIPSCTSGRDTEEYYSNVVSVYDSIIKEYDIDQNKLVLSGFSSGYQSTFGVLNEYLSTHPDSDPASVYLVETYIQSGDTIADYQYDKYKENGTIFYSYTGGYGSNGNYSSLGITYDTINDPLVDNGCNVINILDRKYIGHQGSERRFFEDNIIDFSNSDVELTSDKYVYKVKNPTTGLWEEIDVSEINTFEKLCDYFGVDATDTTSEEYCTALEAANTVNYLSTLSYLSGLDLTTSSDMNALSSYVSNIYAGIRGSNFVSLGNVPLGGYSSTTNVPSSVSGIVNTYFSNVAELLSGLGNLLKSCEAAGLLLEEQEKQIAKAATEVNDNVDSDVVATAVPVTNLSNTSSDTTNGATPVSESRPTTSTPTTDSGDTITNATPVSNTENSQTDTGTTPVNDSTTTSDTTATLSEDSPSWVSEFPTMEELYTTDNQTVFNYNDEYRIVVHHEGNTITGVEYYYDFGSIDNANSQIDSIVDTYMNMEIDNIMMKDQYVKVVFNENIYSGMGYSDFIGQYSSLSQITKI